MKIRTKLVCAFGVITLMTLGVAIFSYFQTQRLSSALYEIGVVRLPSIQGLNAVREAMSELDSLGRALAQESDQARLAEIVERQKKAWERLAQGWTLYEPLPQSQEEALRWKAFVPAWNEWKTNYLATTAAKQISPTTARLYGDAMSLLGEITAINDQIVREEKLATIGSFEDTERVRRTTLMAAVLALVVAVGGGVALGRVIIKPISQIVQSLEKIAKGDLSSRIAINSKDEIGDVARATNCMAEELSASAARLKALSDNLPADMVYQVERTPDGRMKFVYVSAGVVRLHGVSVEEAMRDSSALYDQILKEDWPALERARAESVAALAPFNVVLRVRRKDGEIRWMHLSSAPRRLPDGRILWDGVERDITDLKRAEEELQWRKAFLEAQVHSSPDGIVVVDKHGNKILQNQRMLDLWHIPLSIASETNHQSQLEFVVSQVRQPQFIEKINYLYDHPEEVSLDEIELKNGVALERYSAPVLDKDGKNYGRIWTFRDITERKRAEERIDLLQTITMDMARTDDLPAAFKLVLRRLCEKTGWALGQAWVVRPDEGVLECASTWLAGGSSLEEFRDCSRMGTLAIGVGLPGRVAASGKAAWVSDVTEDDNFPRAESARRAGLKAGLAVPIASGPDVVAVLEFFLREPRVQDERLVDLVSAIATQIGLVVERKLAEEQLRRRGEQMRLLLNSTGEGIFGVDLLGKCTFCNPASIRLLGYEKAAELLGQDMHLLIASKRADGAPYPKEECPVVIALMTGENVHSVDDVFWRKDKTQFPTEYWAYPIYQGQERIGAVVTFQDITERQRADREVRDSRERLRALAGRLQAVREEERTRIAREIHDVLAQELALFKIELGWLSKRLAPNGKELDQPALFEKVAALSRMADSAIVTVQKIAAELRPVALDSLGLAAAIEWQAEEFQQRTAIQCDAVVADDDFQLDREAATNIFRIVQESLTNVIRHAEATRVEVILERDSGLLRLIIQDNGIGFDETAMKDPHSLGLLGMRERALMLEGEFAIRGERGKGTRVSVTFPLDERGGLSGATIVKPFTGNAA